MKGRRASFRVRKVVREGFRFHFGIDVGHWLVRYWKMGWFLVYKENLNFSALRDATAPWKGSMMVKIRSKGCFDVQVADDKNLPTRKPSADEVLQKELTVSADYTKPRNPQHTATSSASSSKTGLARVFRYLIYARCL